MVLFPVQDGFTGEVRLALPQPARIGGSQEALSMQDAARKGREPADWSGKGRRRRGPLKSQREKRCFFFFFLTLYMFWLLN